MFDNDDRVLLLHGIVVVASRFYTGSTDDNHTTNPAASVSALSPLSPAQVQQQQQQPVPQQSHPLEAYIKSSRDHLLLRTTSYCTLLSAQALCLLAIDSLSEGGQGPRVWNIMSMLICTAHHLCLSRTPIPREAETESPLIRNEAPDEGINLGIIGAEERRRLFWVVYAIDHLSSVSHGQYVGTDTKRIRLPYPASDDDWGVFQ